MSRGSSSSYTGRENRSRRDDERDRMRNLPNRLKNKRSEEMLSGVSDKREEKLDKPTDKDKTDRSGGERGYNRQVTLLLIIDVLHTVLCSVHKTELNRNLILHQQISLHCLDK